MNARQNLEILIVTQANLASVYQKIIESITEKKSSFHFIDVSFDLTEEEISETIAKKIQDFPSDQELLICTDVFGASPCNHCLGYLKQSSIQVISGINLPMLLKLATSNFCSQYGAQEAAQYLQNYGRKNIIIASEIVKK